MSNTWVGNVCAFLFAKGRALCFVGRASVPAFADEEFVRPFRDFSVFCESDEVLLGISGSPQSDLPKMFGATEA